MKRLWIVILLVMSCVSLQAEQLTDSVRVHFRVNQMVIDTLLMGNDAAMRGFTQRMRVLKGLKDVTVDDNDSISAPDSLMASTIEIQAHPESKAEYGNIIAIKTNLLYDLCATPSIGFEKSIGKHFSVGANWMYAWWHNHERNRHWRIYGGDINARYYFGNNENRPSPGITWAYTVRRSCSR